MRILKRLFDWLILIAMVAFIVGFIFSLCGFATKRTPNRRMIRISSVPPMPDGSPARIASGKIVPSLVVIPVLTKTLVSWDNKPGVIYTVQASTNGGAAWFIVASNSVSTVRFDAVAAHAFVRVGAIVAQPAPFPVALSWIPSVSAAVNGYFRYYGAAAGVWTNRAALGNVTNTTVTNLIPGVKYFFAVTASDTSGVEGLPSNEVSYQSTAPDLSVSNLKIIVLP